MAGIHNDARHLGQGHVVRHAVDIGAGNHGVLHLKIVKAQNAQQHGFLVRFHLAFGSGFKNGFFQGFFVVVPEKSAQARPDGTMTVGASVQNNLLVWARFCGFGVYGAVTWTPRVGSTVMRLRCSRFMRMTHWVICVTPMVEEQRNQWSLG